MFKRVFVSLIVAAGLVAGSAAAQTAANSLGKIKAAKAINVAYSPESLPFSFNEANNQPAGYSIDLCKRVIAQIGRAVGEPNLKVNWLAGSVTERLQMVASGRAELECANTTQTQSRLANVDFSNLIFIDGGGFLVKAGSPINQIPDLAGKKIAVLKGTTTETRLNDVLKKRLVNATVVPIADAGAGVTMVESGAVDAYAGRQDQADRARRAVEGPGQALAAGGGAFVRAVRAGAAAQRLRAAPRGQSRADAGLPERRNRDDIHAVAGQAGPAVRTACRHVHLEFHT